VFGEAGAEIVIEEFMEGEELSVFALCDGKEALTLLPSQDHKRVGERDTGPNTGGMGAYAPVSLASESVMSRIEQEILLPTLEALAREGRPFRGLLYAGLMLTADGARVVEFNCRFGDPETQVVLPLLESPLLEPIARIARGESLAGLRPAWRRGAAVTTVLAAGGYPGNYRTGDEIRIPAEVAGADDVLVFHAGTEVRDGRLLSTGGRVLSITGLGADVAEAAARSHDAAAAIELKDGFFRRDIGWREIERLDRRG
jgi:phosphoribosylamine---glycine ligase